MRVLLAALVLVSMGGPVAPPGIAEEMAAGRAISAPSPLPIELVRVQGLHRAVRFYRPKRLGDPPALIIALHGSGGDGERFRHLTDGAFDRVADQQGWLVAYPDALGRQWHDCRARAPYRSALVGVDDIAFLRAVGRHAEEIVGGDLAGVFVVGYSNGGHLVFRIALQASSGFSAVAAIGAHLPVPDERQCGASDRPISILLVSGTEDPINPWAGGEVRSPGGTPYGRVVSAEATAAYFTNLAGLAGPPSIEREPDRDDRDGAWVETRRWAAEGGMEVVLIVVHGGGHSLPHPTAPFPAGWVGRTCRDMDGAKTIGDFFARHLLPPRPP